MPGAGILTADKLSLAMRYKTRTRRPRFYDHDQSVCKWQPAVLREAYNRRPSRDISEIPGLIAMRAATYFNATATRKTYAMPRKKLHSLVIEDNQDLARLFADLLEVVGCSTDVAWSGKTGIEMARQQKPNLIFCDLTLPGEKDGYDVAREIRASDQFDHTMLVAITGFNHPEAWQKARESGFDHMFTKPIKFAQLQQVISAYR